MNRSKLAESFRKCSPIAATALGATVCLSGGQANAISGNVSASNGGAQTFTASHTFALFNGAVTVALINPAKGRWIGGGAAAFGAQGGGYLNFVNSGVNVSGLYLQNIQYVPHNASNKYVGVRFSTGFTVYGWAHVVSTSANGNVCKLDTWSYNNLGGAIKTLDESITPRKLTLSNGRVKLLWNNANEDGVSRYEVQAKDTDGAWIAVDHDTPGSTDYAATVAAGEYRLHVESADGTSRTINF